MYATHFSAAARCALCCVLMSAASWGQAPSAQGPSEIFIYPSQGQTPEQQANDKMQCSGWATQTTGFDPARALQQQQMEVAQAQQQSQQAQQSAAKQANSKDAAPAIGTVGGAAGGAVIGAIAGNAGKGAAIGAATGLLAGIATMAKSKSSAAKQEQQEEQQIAAQKAQEQTIFRQRLGDYNRAFEACMQGRGYTVK